MRVRYTSINIDVTTCYGLVMLYYNSHFEALTFNVNILINGAIVKCLDHENRDTIMIMEFVYLYGNITGMYPSTRQTGLFTSSNVPTSRL